MDLKLLIKLNYIHYTLNTIISVNPNQKLYGVTKTWILATAEAWNLPKWYMSIVSCNNTSWGPLMGLTKDTIDLSIHFISYRMLISRSLSSPQNVFVRLSNPNGQWDETWNIIKKGRLTCVTGAGWGGNKTHQQVARHRFHWDKTPPLGLAWTWSTRCKQTQIAWWTYSDQSTLKVLSC